LPIPFDKQEILLYIAFESNEKNTPAADDLAGPAATEANQTSQSFRSERPQLQYKVKHDECQCKDSHDLTSEQVCGLLGVSRGWLNRHGHIFKRRQQPGRGCNGREWRYDRESIEAYRDSGFKEIELNEDPYRGKSVTEIAAIAKERVRRGLVSTSS